VNARGCGALVLAAVLFIGIQLAYIGMCQHIGC
jgi:hypothetical protein